MQQDAAPTGPVTVHASCVALQGGALLITGKSGRGKSALALQLMSFGAQLVADDRTILTRQKDLVFASSPATIRGLIEARGIGLLKAQAAPPTPVLAQVDLERAETARLPEPRKVELLGQSVPLLCRVDAPHFAAALMQYLKAGRQIP